MSTTTTMPTIPALANALSRVEDEIRELATSSTLPIVNSFSGRITAAGGKRLRSVVVLAGSLALAGEVPDKAITAAACVELLHAGSLVHDDLMDNAAERRGVPTVNSEWGPGPAVLVGDFMLARASQAALEMISPYAAGKLAAAVTDLVEGQVLEVLDLYDVHRSPDSALRSIALKTGALFRVGCVLAAHCSSEVGAGASTGAASEGVSEGVTGGVTALGVSWDEISIRLAEYGAHFGLLFQILDDLLDLTSSVERLGKPVGNDIRQGVYTFPLLRSLTDVQREFLVRRGKDLGDDELAGLLGELRAGGLVSETVAYCRNLADQTVRALPEVPESEALGILRQLPTAYLDWAVSQIA